MYEHNFNILVTSAGRKVWLVNAFKEALKALGIEGNVVAADVSETAPAMYVADKSCQVCSATDPKYVPELLRLCKDEKISLVIPLIDTELLPLADNKEQFRYAGTTVLISSPEVVKVTNDKRITHQFLRDRGFDTPDMLDIDSLGKDSGARYPMFVKPAMGAASVGAARVDSEEELMVLMKSLNEPILQEHIEGQEFTLDVLVDFEGSVRCVVPRKRLTVRAGESNKAVTAKDRKIMDVGRRLVELLPGASGPITVQGFLVSDGRFVITDINPRFGSGVPVALKADADYPRWIIELALGNDPIIPFDEWQDGVLMMRYEEAVFLRADWTACL